ncbi:hypothetical protein ACFRFH_04390 [Leifsonia sp. NPDC056824]|uniref:hypothetical protein n=1 Tax=Leifsonia sp. NPDC056824 TaxID=3345953 RepID=UPI0036C6A454
MDPADFVQELFDGLDREIQSGVQEVQDWIEAQVHGAAVQLLDSLMPPIVHAGNSAVKVSESAIVVSAAAGIGLALGSAEVGNTVLAGAVADTVQRGIGELKAENDYAKGVNSIAW